MNGSDPPPKIRWFRGSRLIETSGNRNEYDSSSEDKGYFSETIRDKVGNGLRSRISYLTFAPQLSDEKQNLVCSAKNPKMLNEPEISDSIEMDVRCKCESYRSKFIALIDFIS